MVRYILSDMDGTLLNEQKQLPKGLGKMIAYIQDQKIQFGVASGRQYYNLKKRLSEYGNDFLYICENGSIVFDGDTCIYVDEIPYDRYLEPIKRLREAKDIFPVLCGIKSAYIEHQDQEFVENCKEYYERLMMVDDILEAAKHDHICKVAIYDKVCTKTNAYPFMEHYHDNLTCVLSGEHWMDLSNPQVNKGKAIRYLKKANQLTKEDFMVFGDYMNDFEMIQECEYSYAMENAYPDIKKIAHYHTCSNDEDGVIKALCEYFDLPYEDYQ